MNSYYEIAQICLSGHIINTESRNNQECNKAFCSRCGEQTIIACTHCEGSIRGRRMTYGNQPYRYTYHTPSYCDKCGKPYPWTLNSQEAAYELIELSEDLNDVDKEDFKLTITELVKDTPKTTVAIVKFNKYLGRAGKVVATGLKDILVDVVSEAVKKSIWG